MTETSQVINWSELRPRVRLSIESRDRRVVVSESLVDLLQAVVEHRSVVAAARALRIPYRTARYRLEGMETRLGVRFFETSSGGPGGGSSRLTPAAQDILRVFAKLREGLDPLVDDAMWER